MRDAFGEALVALGREDPNLVVLNADLATSTRTDLFQQHFPRRHLNLGIAEQNMLGVAAGLSIGGKTPVVSGFAPFTVGRAWEFLRLIAHDHLNVKVCPLGGVLGGYDGATHQFFEDFALTRCLPGVTVLAPADEDDLRAALAEAVATPGPYYIRVARQSLGEFPAAERAGDLWVANPDRPHAIVATGVLSAWIASALAQDPWAAANVTVYHCRRLKPFPAAAMQEALARHPRCWTAEEHSVVGGLGDAVLDATGGYCQVHKIGVADRFGTSGAPQEVLDALALSPRRVLTEMREILF
jgi:transketolase